MPGMIKYGSEHVTELRFDGLGARMELRNDQWIDIDIRLTVAEATPVPDDLIDLTALVITNTVGQIAQIVPQDEGCDCDYQFTAGEKEQLAAYVESPAMQERIANLAHS
jgi:hypothetical protein